MDKQFITKLQSLDRQDKGRSSLLMEGVKSTLKHKKEMGRIGRYLHKLKKPVVPKGWD
ncbi:hypothetical protein [Paenibacillus methanolicus]|uniref:Uncharacterized protein n=1 Tax=Paenibacillus methanolicus TaxID=582686 RepID=A0A5S5CK45_9BACL|nr:hypothetical protein [Paenibacillus methanolicus]TYP78951.1 hypothetical protein BCM02_10166 [Paenibacillus methanolicus]